MPRGENLTPFDVAILHDLVAWAQDQDHDAFDPFYLEFLSHEDEVDEAEIERLRASLDKLLTATEEWF